MKLTHAALAAAMTVLLGACATGPDVRGKPVPTAYFIFYEKDTVTPTEDASASLDEAAAFLTQYDNTSVRIVGHVSADETVTGLDQQRASHVAEELAKRGAQPPRMQLLSVGNAESISTDDPAADRRVEILFVTM
ncbi:MAG: OmpA family [Pseudomonadota bacterium]